MKAHSRKSSGIAVSNGSSCKSARGVNGQNQRKLDLAKDDADLKDAAAEAANKLQHDAPERSSGGKVEQ